MELFKIDNDKKYAIISKGNYVNIYQETIEARKQSYRHREEMVTLFPDEFDLLAKKMGYIKDVSKWEI